MAERPFNRRLAAILAADVVGYSALMRAKEEATLAAVRSDIDQVFAPCIDAHGGRIFKTTGDGLLVEFASVVDAVRCAILVQHDMAARNAGRDEADRILFRIGINLGDVVSEGDDLYGDGVNVASRLESLSAPGGLCVSEDVYRQIQGKVDAPFEDRGLHELKNIDGKIRVFGMAAGLPAEAGKPAAMSSRSGNPAGLVIAVVAVALFAAAGLGWWWQTWQRSGETADSASGVRQQAEKPSIGVLPFADMSEAGDHSYFSDGLAVDLITDLSRISGLSVIARSSTFAYRGQSKDVREIGRELGARYIVDGSVRKITDRVRINTQLIDAENGETLWAERFDRSLTDLFDTQEEVREQIILALEVKLSSREREWMERRPTSSPEAYDNYLRGLQQVSFFSREANTAARTYFERAIALDPGFAAAYSQLAQTYSLAKENGWAPDESGLVDKALSLAKRAVELDDELPQAYWSLARIYSRPPFLDSERAIAALETAIELDPNFADGYAFLGSALNASGHAEQALGALEKAMRINPRFPFWYYFELGRSQFFLTRFEAAEQNFQKAIERNPSVGWPHRWLVATYGHLGRVDDAEWEMSELQSI
ncbi:MAG TPA: adenylate/guanylate cyclase domain-containing protein, partial [Afifellaceae bacterium]|nr:adenylate/guanylate cyclase domain-containing protein [Afifellaceae bacterium]